MEQVAFARSTWRKAKDFQEGLRELAQKMPLVFVRAYLAGTVNAEELAKVMDDRNASDRGATGESAGSSAEKLIARIDSLQALRASGIGGEMQYVAAQVEVALRERPEEVARAIESIGVSTAEAMVDQGRSSASDSQRALNVREDEPLSAADVLGEEIMTGADIRFGFGPEVYQIAPSLKVYELFMWFDENEL